MACERGNLEAVRLLLARKADIGGLEHAHSPLGWAVESGNPDVVKLLVEAGADPNKARLWGDPILSKASQRGNLKVVRLLVEHGAKLETSGTNSTTPLQEAARFGHKDVVDYLLDKGADIDGRKGGGATFTPLMSCIYIGRPNTAIHLIERGAAVDVFSAAGLGLTARLREILAADIQKVNQSDGDKDVTYENGLGRPLNWAARFGQLDAVKLLVEKGADINANSGFWGRTPLHEAASRGSADIVLFLLECGAKVDARTGKGNDNATPLSCALPHKDNEKVVQILLDHAADPLAVVGGPYKYYRVIDGPHEFVDVDLGGKLFSYDTSKACDLLRQHVAKNSATGPATVPATRPAGP